MKKSAIVAAFRQFRNSQSNLQQIIKKAVKHYDRNQLIQFAVEAGYSESHAKNVVSGIMISLNGKHENKSHVRISAHVKEFAIKVLKQECDGDKKEAKKLLLSAYRWLKKSK